MELLLIIIGAGSFLAYIWVYVTGQGALYFMYIAIGTMPFIIVKNLYNSRGKVNFKHAIIKFMFMVIVVLEGYGFCKEYSENVKRSVEYNIKNNRFNTIIEKVESRRYSLTNQEFQCLKWIRENSLKDSTIAFNRYYFNELVSGQEDARNFYSTAYSERQAFLEGFAFSRTFTSNKEDLEKKLQINRSIYFPENQDTLQKILEENKIDFVMVYKAEGYSQLLKDYLVNHYDNEQCSVFGKL